MKYFVHWRAVWKEGSVTHACRMVFDGSQAMKCGCSLNSLLPKGMNRMNKLVEIMIRWSTWKHAFHTDIVTATVQGRDGTIRLVEVEYQNPDENIKRRTNRGVRELIVIQQVNEIDLSKELYELGKYVGYKSNNLKYSTIFQYVKSL